MRRLCLSLPVLFATASAASAAAPLPPELVEQAEREGTVRVIVRLAAPALVGRELPAERTARRAAIERAADAALARLGGSPHAELRRYSAFPLLALELRPDELADVAQADEVLALEPDRVLHPSLTESIPRVGAGVTTSAGFDGSGAVVVVADTGVDANHPFFGGRVVAEACFSRTDCPNGEPTQVGPGSAVPCDYGSLCWHGTHVAGIAAGISATRQGVAPGASLIAIQVGSELSGAGCGDAGSPCVVIQTSDALSALDYVADTLAEAWNIAAVNMSFGSAFTWDSESSCDAANGAYETVFAGLRGLGIAPVAAAGNGSVTNGISSPACVSSAIAVGATDDLSESIWQKSNSGPPLDFFAPGVNIISSYPLGNYAQRTGTSMATPHVAGAFAVLRQADPAASVATLKAALESTGLPITDNRGPVPLVRPRLQVDDAVRSRAPAACFDGLDNDGDGRIDVDGDGGTPDPNCADGFDTSENQPTSCGLGPELALALSLLAALRLARKRT